MKRLSTICELTVLVLAVTSTASAVTWNVPGDYLTIQDAIDSPDVLAGHTILVAPGNHFGALVTKEVEIKGEGGAVINDGPPHSHPNIENQIIRLPLANARVALNIDLLISPKSILLKAHLH